ncbi:MAG: 3-phosphoshikimate 1-carboxyvinyltransferase [Deltaproteobacteria bacterium]|jgi:3-phosphoshikimate 1-carboxyvinyltransferase|nr:3-phosphoshikimate 1-carboxyvinyltransferase [Deltaproteobacteria bacterium]
MPLIGQFTPPGDKSISHRLILMSIIANGEMLVSGLSGCDDVNTSLSIFKQLGGQAATQAKGLAIKGLGGAFSSEKTLELDCRNSGTTIRLLMGLLSSLKGRFILDGDNQLRKRPMERVAKPLRAMGAKIETKSGNPPVIIEGSSLAGGDFQLTQASAQLKSAILLAGLQASSPTSVTEPAQTRDHTERLINYWGGRLTSEGLKNTVQPSSLTLSRFFSTPSDPSSAAFFLVAASIVAGSQVSAQNMLMSYGRTGFLRVLDKMGAKVSLTMTGDTPEPTGEVTVQYDGPLKATTVEADQVPSLIDEIPILALAATQAKGTTVFHNVGELRIKETDRLTSIRHQLGALGARINVEGDDLIIEGPTSFILPQSLDSGHDHRLAMMLTLALKIAGAKIPIIGEESISISYPTFQDDLNLLWKD